MGVIANIRGLLGLPGPAGPMPPMLVATWANKKWTLNNPSSAILFTPLLGTAKFLRAGWYVVDWTDAEYHAINDTITLSKKDAPLTILGPF